MTESAETMLQPARPLRVCAVVKQVPGAECFELGSDGRLTRRGIAAEMNPYCRRAVSKSVELAAASGGSCVVVTLGPPDAEDVLREAIAWGADEGVHLCGAEFAGSDTLATARALATAIDLLGPFDLVLAGRNSIDGDTGQVPPEVAQLLDLPFAEGVRELRLRGEALALRLEHDDGWEEVELALPAVLSVAERLCEPCKVEPERRQAVPAHKVRRLGAADLGAGPWGDAGSPTSVGAVRRCELARARRVLQAGDASTQAADAVAWLVRRSLLGAAGDGTARGRHDTQSTAQGCAEAPPLVVITEPRRHNVGTELIGAAGRLAARIGGRVVAVVAEGQAAPAATENLAGYGVSEVLAVPGTETAEDVATALTGWCARHTPRLVLAPSTAFGREVSGRVAAALGAGLIGDAVDIEVRGDRLVASKPAFAGAMVADVTSDSAVQMVTVRPGVLPPALRSAARLGDAPPRTPLPVTPRHRIRRIDGSRNDDVEVLARAATVVGVGTGVSPEEYADLQPLLDVLGAELAATRKVTDRGWIPRARQVGITGRGIAPRLYVAIGLSGKFNHMVGVRSASAVVGINSDPSAPLFEHVDLGIIGDWREIVPALVSALRARRATMADFEGSAT